MNNNHSVSESNTVLPHDLIMYDILTRVPIESVVQFTCVCKLWSKYLLNNKRFALLHQNNSPYSSPPGIIHNAYDENTSECHISVFDVDKNKRKIIRSRPETDPRWFNHMEIEQSFNGLLLLRRHNDYIVENPITGHSVNLPVPVGVELWDCKFRLAYDPVGENYKAVCFGDDEYFCKILTLGEFGRDCWRNLVKPGFRFNKPYCSLRNGVVFWNGILYWITEDPKTVKKELYSVDVSTETLYATKLPNDASLSGDIVKMGGLLCYYELNHLYKQVKLWVLKKNIDNQCEWVRQRNIELERSFQNAARVLSYDDFEYNCVIVEIVKNPRLKIIFLWLRIREDGVGNGYLNYEYYSCDVELNKIELILDTNMAGKGEWHVNSIAYI